MVKSEWIKDGESYQLKIKIPFGSEEATIYVLANNPDQKMEGKTPVKEKGNIPFLKMDNGFAVFQIGSGEYLFSYYYKLIELLIACL